MVEIFLEVKRVRMLDLIGKRLIGVFIECMEVVRRVILVVVLRMGVFDSFRNKLGDE